jgi:guanosine-3',5'-bis(diphosphate) 3'-pyrophosphohydrolase
MISLANLDIIFKAITFAARKHQGQVRKDKRASPYITHPLAVAQEILTTGEVNNPTILIAAILHDTIEDTDTTPAEIQTEFGDEVLKIVLEVSDDKSLSKMHRKQLQVVSASQLSYAARIIKLADKITNCRDILDSPPQDWSQKRCQEYIQWAADVIAQFRGTNKKLENSFDELIDEAQTKLDFHVQPFTTIDERPWGPGIYPS